MKDSAEFEKWFVTQFGERPSIEPVFELQGRVDSAIAQKEVAQTLLARVEEWDQRHYAAYLAFTAQKRDEEKNRRKRHAGRRRHD